MSTGSEGSGGFADSEYRPPFGSVFATFAEEVLDAPLDVVVAQRAYPAAKAKTKSHKPQHPAGEALWETRTSPELWKPGLETGGAFWTTSSDCPWPDRDRCWIRNAPACCRNVWCYKPGLKRPT